MLPLIAFLLLLVLCAEVGYRSRLAEQGVDGFEVEPVTKGKNGAPGKKIYLTEQEARWLLRLTSQYDEEIDANDERTIDRLADKAKSVLGRR